MIRFNHCRSRSQATIHLCTPREKFELHHLGQTLTYLSEWKSSAAVFTSGSIAFIDYPSSQY